MVDEQLRKLEELRVSGALTEEEFQFQRSQLTGASQADRSYSHGDGDFAGESSHVDTDDQSKKSLFSTIGLVLFTVGLVIVFYAGWIYDPSVSSSPDIGGSSVQEILDSYERAKALGPTRVNNTGLLNRQLIIALLGVAVMICGGLMYAASKIIDAIERR